MNIWEFLTGGPVINSSSTVDKGVASHTVHQKEPTKETWLDGG